MARSVALLRGINVGGNRLIKMAALKVTFERLGLADVQTYIVSGNVVFSGKVTDGRLTAAIKEDFGHDVPVTLRTAAQLAAVVADAPRGFGKEPAKYRYDVLFTFGGATASSVLKQLEFREGVDAGWVGKGCVYFSRLIARASSSKLTKVTQLPVYQQLTIRNWNTTTKLASLAAA